MRLKKIITQRIDDTDGTVEQTIIKLEGEQHVVLEEGTEIKILVNSTIFLEKAVPAGKRFRGTIKITGALEDV